MFLHFFQLLVCQMFSQMFPELEQTPETVTAGVTNKLDVPDVQVPVTEGRLLRDHVGHGSVTLGLEVSPDSHVAYVGGVNAPPAPPALDTVLALSSEIQTHTVSVRIHPLKPVVLNMVYSSFLYLLLSRNEIFFF